MIISFLVGALFGVLGCSVLIITLAFKFLMEDEKEEVVDQASQVPPAPVVTSTPPKSEVNSIDISCTIARSD